MADIKNIAAAAPVTMEYLLICTISFPWFVLKELAGGNAISLRAP
jgi:hypothetical protein